MSQQHDERTQIALPLSKHDAKPSGAEMYLHAWGTTRSAMLSEGDTFSSEDVAPFLEAMSLFEKFAKEEGRYSVEEKQDFWRSALGAVLEPHVNAQCFWRAVARQLLFGMKREDCRALLLKHLRDYIDGLYRVLEDIEPLQEKLQEEVILNLLSSGADWQTYITHHVALQRHVDTTKKALSFIERERASISRLYSKVAFLADQISSPGTIGSLRSFMHSGMTDEDDVEFLADVDGIFSLLIAAYKEAAVSLQGYIDGNLQFLALRAETNGADKAHMEHALQEQSEGVQAWFHKRYLTKAASSDADLSAVLRPLFVNQAEEVPVPTPEAVSAGKPKKMSVVAKNFVPTMKSTAAAQQSAQTPRSALMMGQGRGTDRRVRFANAENTTPSWRRRPSSHGASSQQWRRTTSPSVASPQPKPFS